MTGEISIRSATLDDAESLLSIYRPFVLETVISFELEPPSVTEFRARIERSLEAWAWLVAEREGWPVGYAYATPHRLPLLAQKGYCNAYAGTTLPNDASVALHRRVGFYPVGVFRSVGRKFGAWHDVSWWHLRLRAEPPQSAEFQRRCEAIRAPSTRD